MPFMRTIAIATVFERRLITLACSVGENAAQPSSLDASYMKFEPLFRQMMLSLVINDRWKK